MQFKHIVSAAAITLITGTSHAWNLVYSHDASGAPTAGSLQTLRTALNNGSSLKVQLISPNVQTWTLYCTQHGVKADASQAVVCLSNTNLGMDVRVGSNFGVVGLPPSSTSYAVNTTGQFVETNINHSNGAVVNRAVSNISMQWFVD